VIAAETEGKVHFRRLAFLCTAFRMNHRPPYSVHTIAELDGPLLAGRRRHVRSRDGPRRRDQRASAVGQHPAYGAEPLAERQRLGVRAVVPNDDRGGNNWSGQDRERRKTAPTSNLIRFISCTPCRYFAARRCARSTAGRCQL